MRSGVIYTQNDIHLDDQNPPVDIIYLKYDRAERLFDRAAWKLIKEHGTVNFYINCPFPTEDMLCFDVITGIS